MGYITKVFYLLIVLLFILTAKLSAQSRSNAADFSTDSIQVESFNQKAWELKNNLPDSARLLALQAISLGEKAGFSKGVADGYHNLGMVQWSYGDRAGALDYYFKALAVRQRINDSLGLGRSYNNIGNVYFAQENYDSATVHYNRGLQIRYKLKDVPGMIYSLSNLGDVALENSENGKAKTFYDESEKLALREKIPTAIAHVKGRMGTLAQLEGDQQKAQSIWEDALSFAEQSGNARLIAHCLQEVVRLMMINQREVLPVQEEYARRSLELASSVNAIDLQTEAAMILAQLSALKGDFEQVYFHQEHYRQLVKTLVERSKNDAITAIQENYEAERTAARKLSEEKKLGAELAEQNNRLFFGLLLSGLLLLAVLAIAFFSAYRKQFAFSKTLTTKNEELAARYTDLRDFAKIVSHDLKEPLRNIGAFANLLHRRHQGQLDESAQEYLGFILSGARKMNDLLEDLLLFTNITNKGKEALSYVDVNVLTKDIFVKSKQEQDKDQAQLTSDPLPEIRGYSTLLKILFEQLIENALKFNEADKPHIHIAHTLEGKSHLITIRDNGIGIEEAYQQQIFSIFQRLDKQKFPGTGVGLAICRRIIEVHKGKIWVESKIGEGSTFFVSLPVW